MISSRRWYLSFALLLLVAIDVRADETRFPVLMPRMRNEDLRAQLAADPAGRFVPFAQVDWLTAAIDGHLFYRSYPGNDPAYYHGGFWFNFFTEFRPTPSVDFNSRFIVYNPAYSYGAVSSTRLWPLFALTWHSTTTEPDAWRWKVRAGDLDRQTVGAGLSLEDKEMGGIRLELTKHDWRAAMAVDGTGGFMHAGDLNTFSLDWRDNLLGAYALRTGFSQPVYGGIFSRHALGDYWSYAAEASMSARGGVAALGRLQFRRAWENGWAFRARVEHRDFPSGFADGYFDDIESTNARIITGDYFPTSIEHDYLAIDTEDKAYVDSPNLFVVGRNVMASAAQVEVHWQMFRGFSLFSLNEYAWIEWRGIRRDRTYFYRHGFRLAVDDAQTRVIDLFAGNKSSSAMKYLDESDLANKSSFTQKVFVALEGRLRF